MEESYDVLKFVHVLGVVIFLGNIIVTAFWKNRADSTRNPVVIAFAVRQVVVTDFLFTAGGAALLLAGGLGNAVPLKMMGIPWVESAMWLFLLTAVIWLAVLVPTQMKQSRMARVFAHDGNIPEGYWKLVRRWNVFGGIAVLLPIIAMYYMLFKPV